MEAQEFSKSLARSHWAGAGFKLRTNVSNPVQSLGRSRPGLHLCPKTSWIVVLKSARPAPLPSMLGSLYFQGALTPGWQERRGSSLPLTSRHTEGA